MLPSLFLAHGAPTIALEHHDYTHFLRELPARMPRPKAIAVLSAHWESPVQLVTGAAVNGTIHDFYGFPQELYEMTYPAPGDIALALEIRRLFGEQGIASEIDDRRGLDHGVWSLLALMYPAADIPVVALSVHPRLVPEEQYRIGKALASLKAAGVLIIGSGGTVHNLGRIHLNQTKPENWAVAFDDWLAEQLETWNLEALFDYERRAPHAREAVPTPEHFVPILLAMGAGDERREAKRLHREFQFGTLSLSAWQFA